jgi:hypothetical protein
MQTAFQRVLQAGLQSPEPLKPTADDGDTVPSTKSTHEQLDALAELTPDDPRAADFRDSLRAWFRHAPWSALRQREIRRWLYWAVFNAALPDSDAALPHAHKAMLEDVLELLRRRTGVAVPPGSNPACAPLLLTIDPLAVWARPLLWYLFVAAANAVVWWRLRTKWQVQYGRFHGME